MPNLHPLVVHFPIALLIVGFLFDVFGLLLRKDWAKRAGAALIVLGSLGALAAMLSGSAAEETVEASLSEAGERVLEAHEALGQGTAYAWLAIAALRVLIATPLLKKGQSVAWGAYVLGAMAGLAMIALTAYRGGELVYTYGGGVQLNAPGAVILNADPDGD